METSEVLNAAIPTVINHPRDQTKQVACVSNEQAEFKSVDGTKNQNVSLIEINHSAPRPKTLKSSGRKFNFCSFLMFSIEKK